MRPQKIMSNRIDKIKFNHWLNIRKTSLDVLNDMLRGVLNYEIKLDNLDKLDDHAIHKITEILKIKKNDLTQSNEVPTYIYNSKQQIKKSKRPIKRGGIHFYNYYTLPSPEGYVAPVLIDILCPKNKLPTLNNGHLEPAITVSLGPNDIYARFAKKINDITFLKFRVNPDKKTDWVVGSNYYEPSYCLHTYSRATDKPGMILSYTTRSNLENLFNSKLSQNSFKNFKKQINSQKPERSFLKQDLTDKGYSLEYLSKKAKVSLTRIKNYFKNNKSKLTWNELQKICKLINSDPSRYIDKEFKEDSIGKYYFDYKDSLKTIRSFKSYKIASIASSPRSPDLTGYFIKVFNNSKKPVTDLLDSTCSHYLNTKGTLNFFVRDGKSLKKIKMFKGDSIWVSSFSSHGFSGNGALIKISDGQNFNYLEKIDLSNTYNLKKTLSRGRKDVVNWGYDTK